MNRGELELTFYLLRITSDDGEREKMGAIVIFSFLSRFLNKERGREEVERKAG